MKRWFISLVGLTTIFWVCLYVLFRTGTIIFSFSTIGGPINKAFMFAFWLSELFILFNAVGYFLNILTSLRFYKPPVIRYTTNEPEVTILIPARDEPAELLARTLIACRYVDYKQKHIVLIDASETEVCQRSTEQVAKEQGVIYFSVPYPRHGAKAGSLNAYIPHIKTPYFVIFDADYRPSKDFLKRLVCQMEEDEKLGFIQTPQFYGNLTVSPVSRASQMQQSIFYEYICEGKSIHQAMFMCGTNLIVRTKAIRDIGGFVEGSITEDFATSFGMIKQGWKSRYDSHTTAFGDGPRNLGQFFRQQYRWARGTIGEFLATRNLLFSRSGHLTFFQRLEFVLAGSYYFVGFVWSVLLCLPILYIFFKVPVYFSDPVLYIFSYIPYFILSLSFFVDTLLTRRYHALDWVASQSLFLLTLPVYIQAGFDALFSRPAAFEGTRKDVGILEIPWKQLWPQVTFIICNGLAIIYGILQLYLFGFDMSLTVNIFWSLLHEFLLFVFITYFYVQARSTARNARFGGAIS